ncbi:MAG: hypothetical protein RL391_503 [Actinomycetota bacterium]|jgi:hypothetical protein
MSRDSQNISGTPTGVLGSPWRALISPSGDLFSEDGRPIMQWFVAADDRWHHPAEEVAIRQQNIEGAAVVETRLRVPGGDIVQTIWSTIASDGRGYTVVRFANESSMPVAVAVSGVDAMTARAVAPDVAPGLSFAEPVRVVPIAHRTSAYVLVPHGHRGASWPGSWSDSTEVVAGWLSLIGRAGRVEVPELIGGRPITELVAAARCRAALERVDLITNPIDRLLTLDERARMNLDDDDVLPLVVESVEQIVAAARRGTMDESGTRLAFIAASRLLRDDPRASSDLVATVARIRRTRATSLPEAWGDVEAQGALTDTGRRLPADVADRLVRWTAKNTATLVPDGLPRPWWGSSCEAFDIAVGNEHRVSFAIRWHGDRPAVLWEVSGPPGLVLRSGADDEWTSTNASGEALWAAPQPVRTNLVLNSEQSFS